MCFAAWRPSWRLIGLPLLLASPLLWSKPPTDAPPLSFSAARSAALDHHPLLQALAAERIAWAARAEADRALPPPELMAGIAGLPVNGDDAGRLDREPMSQVGLSLQQRFPNRAKRDADHALATAEAVLRTQQQAALRLDLRAAVSRDWLTLWRGQQRHQLLTEDLINAEAEAEAAAIAFRQAGASRQSALLAAQLAVAEQQDRIDAEDQAIAVARSQLTRWLPSAAPQTVSQTLPEWPDPIPMSAALAQLEHHPRLAADLAQLRRQTTALRRAKADDRPDFRTEIGIGYRSAYNEMLTLQVGMDLPWLTANRQSQRQTAASADLEASAARAEDTRRQLHAQLRAAYHDWQRLHARQQQYQDGLLPTAEAQVSAALAGWRSGREDLSDVLNARRQLLALRLAALDLRYQAALRHIELEALGAMPPLPHWNPTP